MTVMDQIAPESLSISRSDGNSANLTVRPTGEERSFRTSGMRGKAAPLGLAKISCHLRRLRQLPRALGHPLGNTELQRSFRIPGMYGKEAPVGHVLVS